jgi:hypothetical protein
VHGPSGAPIIGARVSQWPLTGAGGTTNVLGSFSFPPRNTPAEYVWAQAVGYRERIVLLGARRRDVALEPAGTLRVRLVGPDGAPVTNAMFSFVPTRPLAFRDGYRRRLRSVTERELVDVVSLLVPWRAGHLVVEVYGSDPWVSSCLDWSDGRPKDLGIVRVVPSGRLTLEAVDRDGAPLRGVSYCLDRPELPRAYMLAGGCGTVPSIPSIDGEKETVVLLAGTHRVFAWQRVHWSLGMVMFPSPDGLTCGPLDVRLAPGESRTLRLVLELPGWLRCTVRERDGRLTHLGTCIVDGPLGVRSVPRSCPFGQDVWPVALPPGSYRIHRQVDGPAQATAHEDRVVEIRSGATTDVVFDMAVPRRAAAVEAPVLAPNCALGRVPIDDAAGAPLPGRGDVRLTHVRSLATTTRPLEPGGVDVTGLEPGEYRVEVVLPPIGPWVGEVRLAARAHLRSDAGHAPILLAQ